MKNELHVVVVFLVGAPVNEAVSRFDVEPFDGAADFGCHHLLGLLFRRDSVFAFYNSVVVNWKQCDTTEHLKTNEQRRNGAEVTQFWKKKWLKNDFYN